MKIYCIKEQLEQAVSLCERVVAKNATLPALGFVLIEAKGKDIIIRATNLELGVEIKVPAKIEAGGIVAVPGGILRSFLSTNRDDKITLNVREGNMYIEGKTGSVVIKTHPHDDFPIIPKPTSPKTFTLQSKDLIAGLRSVWYSAAISSMKPELSSVYVREETGDLIFVATDSFRLAEKSLPVKKVDGFGEILIPSKNLPEIIKVLETTNGAVTILVEKNQISFEFDGVYIMSRVIEGTFPDYKQIIPKEFMAEATMLRQDLVDALKISHIFSDSFNQLTLDLKPGMKEITITSLNGDVGQSTQKIPAKITGGPLEIKFNFKYIADSLQSIATDSVTIKFAGPGRPAIIKGASDESFSYLVMPMNR